MITALILYLFLPHVSNNHRAKLLNPLLIGLSVIIFLLGQVGMVLLPRYTPVVLAYVSSVTPEKIIQLTNQERVKEGLPQVQSDPELTQAALRKAAYMFAKNYWAHTAPDGTEPWKFVIDAGYNYRFAGENLARDFATPEAAVAAWMASPAHKENLLSTRYRDMGVAVVQGELNGVQTTLIVQFFGTKMSKEALTAGSSSGSVKPETSLPKFETLVAGATTKGKFFLSPFLATQRVAFFFVSLFFLILAIDMILVHHKNIMRISSKSLAHAAFLGMILIVVWISKSGLIL